MDSVTIHSKVKLRDGHEMPILGYGTYELEGNAAYEGVLAALEAGYRHIDSAAWYDNEREVGQAILDFCLRTGTSRNEIFFTTKLKLNNGYSNVKKAIQRSLDQCGLRYIDLYLIHGPLGGSSARRESWRAICDFQTESGGLLKSIGISTFGIRHINDILEMGLSVPAVHQIDLHPFRTRQEIVEYSRQNGMVLEAWAPLARGYRFKHPCLTSMSEKYSKEPAQVLLRYSIQKGYVPLPKSASKDRIFENTKIFDFEINSEDMSKLDSLDEDLNTDWDPTNCS